MFFIMICNNDGWHWFIYKSVFGTIESFAKRASKIKKSFVYYNVTFIQIFNFLYLIDPNTYDKAYKKR